MDLAALDREAHLGGRLVALHDGDLGAGELVERGRQHGARTGRADRAEDDLALLRLLDRLHRRGVPDHAVGDEAAEPADPGDSRAD